MSEESMIRLQQYGYTHEEAQFLSLAALHSGYFVRRQFNEFLGQQRGGNAQRFIEKLLRRRHAQCERYQTNQFVYHIRGKGIYASLGQRDNRNRREKAPFTIKRKLMCLDFVLAHRNCRFLETETEKVEYFVAERGLDMQCLPARQYQSRRASESAEHFFVDKLPIFLDGSCSPLSSAVVHFAYIDEGAQSPDGFATFLRRHRPLFQALGQFEVIYAAAHPQWFPRAEEIFRRICGAKGSEYPLPPEAQQLLEYFQARRKFERRDFSGFDAERIIRYREEKRRFGGEQYEDLYRRWIKCGTAALFPHSAEQSAGSFRTHLLACDYDIFGGIRHVS
jgi:hypothetical protein